MSRDQFNDGQSIQAETLATVISPEYSEVYEGCVRFIMRGIVLGSLEDTMLPSGELIS